MLGFASKHLPFRRQSGANVAVDCDVACPRSTTTNNNNNNSRNNTYTNANRSAANESEKTAGRWGAIKSHIDDDGQLRWRWEKKRVSWACSTHGNHLPWKAAIQGNKLGSK